MTKNAEKSIEIVLIISLKKANSYNKPKAY